jgi:hypothetical protein
VPHERLADGGLVEGDEVAHRCARARAPLRRLRRRRLQRRLQTVDLERRSDLGEARPRTLTAGSSLGCAREAALPGSARGRRGLRGPRAHHGGRRDARGTRWWGRRRRDGPALAPSGPSRGDAGVGDRPSRCGRADQRPVREERPIGARRVTDVAGLAHRLPDATASLLEASEELVPVIFSVGRSRPRRGRPWACHRTALTGLRRAHRAPGRGRRPTGTAHPVEERDPDEDHQDEEGEEVVEAQTRLTSRPRRRRTGRCCAACRCPTGCCGGCSSPSRRGYPP